MGVSTICWVSVLFAECQCHPLGVSIVWWESVPSDGCQYNLLGVSIVCCVSVPSVGCQYHPVGVSIVVLGVMVCLHMEVVEHHITLNNSHHLSVTVCQIATHSLSVLGVWLAVCLPSLSTINVHHHFTHHCDGKSIGLCKIFCVHSVRLTLISFPLWLPLILFLILLILFSLPLLFLYWTTCLSAPITRVRSCCPNHWCPVLLPLSLVSGLTAPIADFRSCCHHDWCPVLLPPSLVSGLTAPITGVRSCCPNHWCPVLLPPSMVSGLATPITGIRSYCPHS